MPGPTLIGPGGEGDDVRDLQARLRQIDWFEHDVTGFYGDVTTEAVRGFQAKRGIPVTGEVDRRTLRRLYAMTTAPTDDELHQPARRQRARRARPAVHALAACCASTSPRGPCAGWSTVRC